MNIVVVYAIVMCVMLAVGGIIGSLRLVEALDANANNANASTTSNVATSNAATRAATAAASKAATMAKITQGIQGNGPVAHTDIFDVTMIRVALKPYFFHH